MTKNLVRYAIVPKGIHVILAANKSTGHDGMYLCKMFDPEGDFPKEYHILINKNNIYESRASAQRKRFKDKLRGFTKAE